MERVSLTVDDSALVEVAFSMVRHNERNEPYVCDPRRDTDATEPEGPDTAEGRGQEALDGSPRMD